MTGSVKIYFSEQGYGFITGSDEYDYFFHVSDCKIPEDELFKGLPVVFDIHATRKGLSAVKVRNISD